MSKVLLATMNTFTKAGRFVSKGQPVSSEEVDYDEGNTGNLVEAPKSISGTQPVLEVSAIAPTGPNPTAPQQIAPDVVQTAAGYEQAGVLLVGEVTKPEKQRIEVVGIGDEATASAQADVNKALADALDHDGDGRKGGSKKK